MNTINSTHTESLLFFLREDKALRLLEIKLKRWSSKAALSWLFCFVQILNALTNICCPMIVEEMKCPKIEFMCHLKKRSMNSYSYIYVSFRRFSFNYVILHYSYQFYSLLKQLITAKIFQIYFHILYKDWMAIKFKIKLTKNKINFLNVIFKFNILNRYLKLKF